MRPVPGNLGSTARPIVVIGGGLAGMAAAARLAKAGHAVELYERTSTLGGCWAPYPLQDGDASRSLLAGKPVLVDDAPAVLGFPAPWRDLFRKSGRPLEAELGRLGYALVPADPATVIFADGSQLSLPTDRGEQATTISRTYGRLAAERWQQLLDRLGDVWQALRPLGLEAELSARRQLPRAVRRRLLVPRTLAELADSLGHPQLSALIRSVGYRQGSVPENMPALAAVELFIARTFGRWQVQPVASRTAVGAGRSSVLVEALAGRLKLRKVVVHLGTAVSGVAVRGGRVSAVATAAGESPAAAVVATTDPWQLFGAMLRPAVGRHARRNLRRLKPALAPRVSHHILDVPAARVAETITLTADGIPTIEYVRPADAHAIRTMHDFRLATPRPCYGVAWHGFRSWLRRPLVTSEIAGLFLAGPFSPAGPGPSHVVASAALAAYGCLDYLS
jgi:phytoene dehydrogenase-like protein